MRTQQLQRGAVYPQNAACADRDVLALLPLRQSCNPVLCVGVGVHCRRVMAAYGKSRRWENFSTKRFKLLPAGRHTASIWIRGNSGNQCYLNGMGMDGECGLPAGRALVTVSSTVERDCASRARAWLWRRA